MNANLQPSPSSGRMVDDITHLRQRLEYFERHIQTRNQEVKNEYNQALSNTVLASGISNIMFIFDNYVNTRNTSKSKISKLYLCLQ